MPNDGPRVAIVGGSLGGLITALQLRDVGCDVSVFERSDVPLEGRGAGIVLHPVTTRFLEEHRLLDLDWVSSWAGTLRYLRRNGAVLLEEPIAYRFTSYATLYAALVGFLEPDRYRLGARLAGFDQDADGVSVRLDGADDDRFELLVGADGVHSTVRGLLFPSVAPAYAGYVAWRGTLDVRELPRRAGEVLGGTLTYFVGDRTHTLSYVIPSPDGGPERRQMNWVWYRNVAVGADLDALMTGRDGVRRDLSLAPGQVQERFVREIYDLASQLPPPFAELVRASEEPFVQVVVDIESPAMVVGRVCLVGDAAFALRPHIAVGTAKAAADAAALSDAMRACGGDVRRALADWEPGQLALGRATIARAKDVGDRVQKAGTYRPGDRAVAFGLAEPGDSNFPGRTRAGV
jgi:2,6-dihydroxypyridine 3-monooxygenase